MADILQILQQFLCYGNSDCINLFNQYSYKPMEGLFYVVFFPIVFIVLFIFIVSSSISPNRGFRALISVAVFAFIIMQGWYYLFAMLGKFWLYLLVFLGFIWILIHTFVGRGKEEGGGAKGRSLGGGLVGKAMSRIGKDIRGDTSRAEKLIDRAIAEVAIIEKAVNRGDTQAWRMAASAIERLNQLRNEYVGLLKGPGGFVMGGKLKHYENKIDEAIKKLQNLQQKAQKMAA